MKNSEAELAGVKGTGYAELIVGTSGRRLCRGVFHGDSIITEGMLLMSKDSAKEVFKGTVYKDGVPHHLTFKVVVTETSGSSSKGTVAHFIATGNPFDGVR